LDRGLELDVLRSDAHAIVGLNGDVDASTSRKLRDRLVGLIADGVRDLVLNLTGTTYLDATGVDVLVRAYKLLSAHEGAFSIVCPHEHLIKLFEAASLSRDLRVFPTVEAARAG
jgi:anti-sigma B factor antagonist